MSEARYGEICVKHGTPACQVCRIAKAFGAGLSDDGELATWHDHSWVVADARNDGTHVHLTLVHPAKERDV